MVWVKSQVMVVKLEVVWVEVAVMGILVVLAKFHFAKKLLPLCHPMEVKSMDYIRDPFFLRSCKYFCFA